MSGEDLRLAAQNGDADRVKMIMRDRGNPCSADEYGLTSLMYAVWNGHLECSKFLVANGESGIDKSGTKRSSLNLTSNKGYTALHISALEIPPDDGKEICFMLLLFGVDRHIRCDEGYTAYQLAERVGNMPVIEAIKEYEQYEKEDYETINRKKTAAEELDMYTGEFQERKLKLPTMRSKVLEKYYFPQLDYRVPKVEEIEKHTVTKPFDVPDHLETEAPPDLGSLPEKMEIHESQIIPLAMEGFLDMEGVKSLRCLEFATEQANINQKRRERLIKQSDPTWKPPKEAAGLPWDEEEEDAENRVKAENAIIDKTNTAPASGSAKKQQSVQWAESDTPSVK